MKQSYLALALFSMILTPLLYSCHTPNNSLSKESIEQKPLSPDDMMERNLQAILQKALRKDSSVSGAVIHIDAPRINLSIGTALGYSDKSERRKLLPQQPVRFASNTKTFVAAAILRLWEDGDLELDAPITSYIGKDSTRILEQGGYRPQEMTIQQLLTHTSGLFDYAESAPFDEAVLKNPQRRWSRHSQLLGAMKWGKPIGKPGDVFNYSDTGYILAGEIIEQVTQKPLPSAVRDLLDFKGLGITKTWWETLEPAPINSLDRVHQYWNKRDSYSWDPSFDLYGGGGLVGPAEELSRFMTALFENKVFRNRKTLDVMLKGTGISSDGISYTTITSKRKGYGMGIRLQTINNMKSYLHSGAWGTISAYFPAIDATITVATNQLRSDAKYRILKKTAKLLNRESMETPLQ